MKIIVTRSISSNEYFKFMLAERGYTLDTFTETYNNRYPDEKVSRSLVGTWSCGRRSLSRTAAIIIQRIACILDDPDGSESDYERYAGIMHHLINGSKICIYEENQKGEKER